MLKLLDPIDRQIIAALDVDGRATLAAIGDDVGLSGPAVGERIRKLREDGVIGGFTVRVDPGALGYTLEAIVRIKPHPQQLHAVGQMIVNEPRFTACDRVTGEDCFIARLTLISVSEIDEILLPIHEHAETHTSIVTNSLLRGRMPDLSPNRTKP